MVIETWQCGKTGHAQERTISAQLERRTARGGGRRCGKEKRGQSAEDAAQGTVQQCSSQAAQEHLWGDLKIHHCQVLLHSDVFLVTYASGFQPVGCKSF